MRSLIDTQDETLTPAPPPAAGTVRAAGRRHRPGPIPLAVDRPPRAARRHASPPCCRPASWPPRTSPIPDDPDAGGRRRRRRSPGPPARPSRSTTGCRSASSRASPRSTRTAPATSTSSRSPSRSSRCCRGGCRRSSATPGSAAEPEIDFITREEKFGTQSPSQRRQISLQMMRTSSQVAQFVALQALGYEDAKILPGEVVVADLVCLEAGHRRLRHATRRPTPCSTPATPSAPPTACRWTRSTTSSPSSPASQPGDTVQLGIERPGEGEQTVEVELIASPDDPTRTIIGFVPFDTASVQLPFEIDIDTGSIGGPSAGLAFTLTLIDELSPGDLTGGDDVAVTGEINLDGTVGAIGGLAQKVSAVRQVGVRPLPRADRPGRGAARPGPPDRRRRRRDHPRRHARRGARRARAARRRSRSRSRTREPLPRSAAAPRLRSAAMAISFSRPDPSSPAAVADAAFGTARRGFDQQEVRDFLRMVAAELARLQERERFLERELRAAQANALPADGMDDDTATRLLGEEAARILQTAREGAARHPHQGRGRRRPAPARGRRRGPAGARGGRPRGQPPAHRRRRRRRVRAGDGQAAGPGDGRRGPAYRERVLGELSRRRELARQQIEQLLHGRDRLLQAFERARLAAVDVVAEITPLGEPDEYVDLTPTTGPVPITASPPADSATPRRSTTSRSSSSRPVVVEAVEPPSLDGVRRAGRAEVRRRGRPDCRRGPRSRPRLEPMLDDRRRRPTAETGPSTWSPAEGVARSHDGRRDRRRRRHGHRHRRPVRPAALPTRRSSRTDRGRRLVDEPRRARRAVDADDDRRARRTTEPSRRRSAGATPRSCRSSWPAPASSSGCSPTSRTRCSTPSAAREPVDRPRPAGGRRRRAGRPLRRRRHRRAGRRRRGRRGVRRPVPAPSTRPTGAPAPVARAAGGRARRAAARAPRAQRRRRRRRQRRRRQAGPRRLSRVEDAAHRRAARRPVPAGVLRGHRRRRAAGGPRDVGGRPRRPAVAGLRGQRARRAGGHRRRRSRRGTRRRRCTPGAAASCSRSTSSVRARAACLGPSPAACREEDLGPGDAHRRRGRRSCSSSCSAGPSPGSTSTTCGTTGSVGPTSSGASSGPRSRCSRVFFAVFAGLAGLNLLIADRLSPTRFPANVHPYVERFHELFGHRLRLVRYIGAGVLAIMVALPTTSQWQSWLLFRNSQSFGQRRRPVRRRRRLLRVRAAVPRLRARLAVRRHGARPDDHAAHARAQRRRRVRLARCRRCGRRRRATSPCCSPCWPRSRPPTTGSPATRRRTSGAGSSRAPRTPSSTPSCRR